MNILEKIKDILGPEKEYPVFNGKNWTPASHRIIKDEAMQQQIADKGYVIVDLDDPTIADKLEAIYKTHHKVKPENGGMFYSVYSLDTDYRKAVHDDVGEVLQPFFDKWLTDYKSVLNSFIIKHPGPRSEFNLHQDSTGLNEWKDSPLSFWMPLQDTTIANGCMWFVPGSQKWFSPYRGISFNAMFDEHKDLLQPYLVPIELKKGQALFFDNRIVHLSGTNESDQARAIIMSGIFPSDVNIISCYRDTAVDGPLEIYQQEEDYLIQGKNFYIDCTARPKTGFKVAEVKGVKYNLSREELTNVIENSGLEPVNLYANDVSLIECDIIQEP